MASTLSAQLKKIAAGSTDALNFKAQKAAHGKSLLYEPKVAASQSFDTLYNICREGFEELCLLDGRFLDFRSTLFSEQSQEQDRTLMTKSQNADLDKLIERFLGLVGSRMRLNPAIKAVEWIVRRFKAHDYNTGFLITTFLPYHTLPIFNTLLAILPAQIPSAYKFLHPYIRSLTVLPRHTVVHSAINNSEFSQTLCSYVLRICKAKQHYPALLSFWAGIMVEAVSGMMDKARSGIKNVQLQEEDKVVKRLLPTLNEGLAAKRIPELRIGCYMILAIMASKGGLDDTLLTAMMEAVVLGWSNDSYIPGLICLSILAQQKVSNKMTTTITKSLMRVDGLVQLLQEINQKHRIDKLASGICVALLTRLSFKGDASVLPIVQGIVVNNLLTEPQTTVVVKSCLAVALRLGENVDADGSARSQMALLLNDLADQPDNLGQVVRQAMENSNVDLDDVELRLNATVRPKVITLPQEDEIMEDGDGPLETSADHFGSAIARLPTRTVDEVSFLSHDKSHIYDDLNQAFALSILSPDHIKQIENAPILKKESAMDEALYLSFFARVWCGPSVVLVRSAALQIVTRRIQEQNSASVDLQGLLPYVVTALGDPAHKVRQAATDLVKALAAVYSNDGEGKKKKKSASKVWGSENIYGHGEHTSNLKWLSTDHAAQFVMTILQPALQACILDRNHINFVIEKSINSHPAQNDSPRKNDTKGLSQSLRLAILSCLASHAIHTPLYLVKYRLLKAINLVKGVASTTRTKVLLPLLHQWSQLSQDQATKACVDVRLESRDFDKEVLNAILPHDTAGLEFMTSIITGQVAPLRSNLTLATYHRYEQIWPSLKKDAELAAAKLLMEVAHWPADQPGPSAESQAQAALVLRTVPLSTEILEHFLAELPTAAKLADKAPATKRRRVSHGEVAKTKLQDSAQLTHAIQEVTFVLELIDGSQPEKHVALLRGLFNTLAELQHFKLQVGSELGYLQGLVLSSLLSIMGSYKANKNLVIDSAGVRADLLVDCIQKTSSPQVQNSALLLIASLADTAPELVLHSVMPIFTFMGSSVLRQNDEYSAHVIKQTISEVIPPLIASLRKAKGDLVTGAAELLLSFVAAYEHVPSHRRKGLYTSLIQTLGASDFLHAMLAMLVDKYGNTNDVPSFATELAGSFGVDVQLLSAIKFLDLVEDVLKPKPSTSAVLLNVAEGSDKEPSQIAAVLLALLPRLLAHKRLVSQTSSMLERDDMDAARVRELYATLLEKLLVLSDTVRGQKTLHVACGETLESLLALLATGEFVKSVESLLDRPNQDLRRKILRSMELRIIQENQFNVVARQAMLGFLPHLTAIIRESDDIFYKHTAVSCVDKIAEKFGKMDLEAVAAAAETIAGEYCLGQSDSRLRVMALLCLSSLVDILREGIVSVLPVAIRKTLAYLKESVSADDENETLHNACYSFVSALLQHLPYMISAKHLKEILLLSSLSATAGFEEESDECRIGCLTMAAKQIDAKVMFSTLDQNWDAAVSAGSEALQEYVSILSKSIERHTKSNVTKNSIVLSSIFRKAFDVRRTWSATSPKDVAADDISSIEEEINAVAIKMIYKFNDSTFRPIFSGLIEWAASGLPKQDKRGRTLRLQSLYTFMTMFFENLKSIVTNYATYILDNVVDILSTVDLQKDESRQLWATTLSTLVQCFSNDQDDFWQSPAHFDSICPVLISQFTHAASLPLDDTLIPAVVELSSAADSADHHKELNTSILKHTRSETAAVRLAAVKCQQALTDKLGEEWLSMLPEMLPFISELQEDDDEVVEKETHRWIVKIEGVLGESLDSMLQ